MNGLLTAAVKQMENHNFCERDLDPQHIFNYKDACTLRLIFKALGYTLIASALLDVVVGIITLTGLSTSILFQEYLGQIPQIFKVLKRRNATGINVISILLMLEASSSTVAYAVWKQFPINTWGENLAFMIENVILVCLLLRYNKRPIAALSFMSFYVIVMLTLIWPLVPSNVLFFLHIISMPVLCISRVMQIYTNFKNHGTGQLSAFSTFLCIFQSFGRLTTSIALTKDWIMILTFVHISILNIIITFQIIYYRQKDKKQKKSS